MAQTLIDIQNNLFGRISRSVENLRKLGPSKINIGQVESRRQILDGNWNKFNENHEALLAIRTEAPADQRAYLNKLPYFANDLMAECEEQYARAKGVMISSLTCLRQPSTGRTSAHPVAASDTLRPFSSANAAPSTSSDTSVVSRSAQATSLHGLRGFVATAEVIVANPETGEAVITRVLFDQGSEASYVTERLTQRLRLRRRHATIPVTGVDAQQSGVTRVIASLIVKSRISPTFSIQIQSFVSPGIPRILQSHLAPVEMWPNLGDIALADPKFGQPGQFDLKLGVNDFTQFILPGRRCILRPFAQETKLGWMILASRIAPAAFSSDRATAQGFQRSQNHESLNPEEQSWKRRRLSSLPHSLERTSIVGSVSSTTQGETPQVDAL